MFHLWICYSINLLTYLLTYLLIHIARKENPHMPLHMNTFKLHIFSVNPTWCERSIAFPKRGILYSTPYTSTVLTCQSNQSWVLTGNKGAEIGYTAFTHSTPSTSSLMRKRGQHPKYHHSNSYCQTAWWILITDGIKRKKPIKTMSLQWLATTSC